MKQELNLLDGYTPTNDLLNDAKQIIEVSQKAAYRAVNLALVQRNWLLGYRIAQEELKGEDRSEYGKGIIKNLADELTAVYGKGFDFGSLYKYCRFYKLYPEILDSVSPKSSMLLSWTHYRVLLQVEDKTARDWYTKEAANQTWSVRTLQRNISSQYYYSLLKSQNQEPVKQEMEKLTAGYQADKLEFIKNPMITEFLGLSGSTDFTESKLESCIITNIQKFLMELGKGSEKERTLTELSMIETELTNVLGHDISFEVENRIQEKIDNDAMLNGYKLIIGVLCVLLAFIGIANVFSNTLGFIRQRKREFARYMSIGMTPEGMRKMFWIEALVIAGRPVLIALPITVVFVWLMITASYLNPMEFLAVAPIVPILLFIAALFGFVALAYYLGGKKILKCDLVEALRTDYMG